MATWPCGRGVSVSAGAPLRPASRGPPGAPRGLAVGAPGHDPDLRPVAAVADAVGRVDDAPAAERVHERVVEARRASEVRDLEGDVVEH